MARLCIIRSIDSAHGKHIHGHTFKIEIHFVDQLINQMVGNLDFHEITPKVDSVINELDKKYIDDIIGTRGTIENIAIYIVDKLKNVENLYSVIVWEGSDKYAEILKEEIINKK